MPIMRRAARWLAHNLKKESSESEISSRPKDVEPKTVEGSHSSESTSVLHGVSGTVREAVYRNAPLVLPENINSDQLIALLSRFVHKGVLSVKQVEDELVVLLQEEKKALQDQLLELKNEGEKVLTDPTEELFIKFSKILAAGSNPVEGIKKLKEYLASESHEEELLFEIVKEKIKRRFEQNMHRHPEVEWKEIERRLEGNSVEMLSLSLMELTGGEPDVVGYDTKTGGFIFFDCSPESPLGRRNLVYDREAERKYANGRGNAIDMALEMGIKILDTVQYREILQKLGNFDQASWNWLKNQSDKMYVGTIAPYGHRIDDRAIINTCSAHGCSPVGGFRGCLTLEVPFEF